MALRHRRERRKYYLLIALISLSLSFFLGSGAVGLSQVDRVYEEGLTSMIQRVQSLSYHYDGRLELHIIGGFQDNKGISHPLSISLMRKLIWPSQRKKTFLPSSHRLKISTSP